MGGAVGRGIARWHSGPWFNLRAGHFFLFPVLSEKKSRIHLKPKIQKVSRIQMRRTLRNQKIQPFCIRALSPSPSPPGPPSPFPPAPPGQVTPSYSISPFIPGRVSLAMSFGSSEEEEERPSERDILLRDQLRDLRTQRDPALKKLPKPKKEKRPREAVLKPYEKWDIAEQSKSGKSLKTINKTLEEKGRPTIRKCQLRKWENSVSELHELVRAEKKHLAGQGRKKAISDEVGTKVCRLIREGLPKGTEAPGGAEHPIAFSSVQTLLTKELGRTVSKYLTKNFIEQNSINVEDGV